MKCPICIDTNLVMSERQGIEIDYCPNCRGIWLDRGELDKIIEKAVASEAANRPEADPYYPPQKGYKHKDYRGHYKKHWLHELFD